MVSFAFGASASARNEYCIVPSEVPERKRPCCHREDKSFPSASCSWAPGEPIIKMTRANRPDNAPVALLSSVSAQAFAHIQPAVLLSLYALRFCDLVTDPAATLATSLPVVAALQVAYVVLCLPPAGSGRDHSAAGSPGSASSAHVVKSGKSGLGLRKCAQGNSRESGTFQLIRERVVVC